MSSRGGRDFQGSQRYDDRSGKPPRRGRILNARRRGDRKKRDDPEKAAREKREQTSQRAMRRIKADKFDAEMGFPRYGEGPKRLGWIFNMAATTLPNEEGVDKAGVDLFLVERGGGTFKATVFYDPYFYVVVSNPKYLQDATVVLTRKFEEFGVQVSAVEMKDLKLANHLSGRKRRLLKLSFSTVSDLVECKMKLMPIVENNRSRASVSNAYSSATAETERPPEDFLETLVDIREYDVPYVMRNSIDQDVRVGGWYECTPTGDGISCAVEWQKDMIEVAEPRVLAFDIECTKAPLKFPQAESDAVFMISYMVDGEGYLIINREVVSRDIDDFEYTPKPSYPGSFTVFNEPSEEALLLKFFEHCRELRPQIYATYNGDYFDWPFVEARAAKYGMSVQEMLGIEANRQGEYRGRCAVHLDAFAWVNRDSYLPQGSRGLKQVTRYKLGYDPVEVDPEDMVPLARSDAPEQMAHYSVSDAVATYYLYTKYVHNFIFSLTTIIPLPSEDVLRKGSGTLCESLLMVEAFRGDILCPNKQQDERLKFHNGHLLESETYIGGHVECLETGVYRSDIETSFELKPSAFEQLIANLDRDLKFTIEVEHGTKVEDIEDYEERKAEIRAKLEALRDEPVRRECPSILHVDVGAMYPNIILTNRLQPDAIVSREDCAACEFNSEENDCKRHMEWVWRGDYTPATRSEFEQVRHQLTYEKVNGEPFASLPAAEQAALVRRRLKGYSQKVYRKTKVTEEKSKVDVVCQRENPFYVDAVRTFRDRRYDYKKLTKTWKKRRAAAEDEGDPDLAKACGDKAVLYDSLQLAHKVILNSFYGYVMRRGARWRSMPMAGIVTLTGANLIRQARELVEQIGRPLELDTDGIWCILPASFPMNYAFAKRGGGSVKVEYPCAIFNADVHETYTNHQYQDRVTAEGAPRNAFATRSENSIFFELDGPYRAMVLPASPEEGKLLKKRYAVFEEDGSLAELKGFELKRRGELEVIKAFQSQIFETGLFLSGENLDECYAEVANVANYWLDVLDSKGADLDNSELLELIAERKVISQTLADYKGQKSVGLTAAARLADFLGNEMVKDKGLNCHLVVSHLPAGAPVTERAVPTAIFSAGVAEDTRRKHLRRWLKDPSLDDVDIRKIIDWEYYKERLGRAIAKIITIPAAMQGVQNPVPRVEHPDWLRRRVAEVNSGFKQTKISALFTKAAPAAADIEELCTAGGNVRQPGKVTLFKRLAGTTRAAMDGQAPASPANDENAADPNAEADAPAPQAAPLMDEDFGGWLAHQKKRWRSERAQLQEERLADRGIAPSGASAGAGAAGAADADAQDKRRRAALAEDGVAGFLQSAQRSVSRGTWQILEVQETDAPGAFTVWAMTDRDSLQRITVHADRTLFVNVSAGAGAADVSRALGNLGARRCFRFLPHGRSAHELYELSVPERRVVRSERALSSLLHHPQVQGVYELRCPLKLHAVIQAGCVAKPAPGAEARARARGAEGGFLLEDLAPVGADAHPYLSPASASYRRLFVYHSRSEARSATALFVLDEANGAWEPGAPQRRIAARATVWMSSASGRLATRPPLKRLWRSVCEAQGLPAGSECSFSLEVTAGVGAALDGLNGALAKYALERNGPTLVVLQGTVPNSSWRRIVPLLNDFPIACMPFNAEDNRFPALAWPVFAAQRMLQRLALSGAWLQDRLQCARYARLPLANIGADAPLAMADVAFARLLRHNRQVLWAHASGRPDLGGLEGDEGEIWAEDLATPTISVSGAYRGICVELELYALAVNAVLAAPALEELEGAMMMGLERGGRGGRGGSGGGGAEQPLGDSAACAHAFRVLRSLVSEWLGEASGRANEHADALLTHFYRWLCAEESKLHDPALHRVVHGLMTKVFLRLVAELRRLGATVVYASFNRMIIATTKTDLRSAQEYVRFVVDTLLAMPVFAVLQLTPSTYWEQLLFMDSENYGGIEAPLEEDPEDADDLDELPPDDAADATPPRPPTDDAMGVEGQDGAGGDFDAGADDDDDEDAEVVASARPRALAAAAADDEEGDENVRSGPTAGGLEDIVDSDEEEGSSMRRLKRRGASRDAAGALAEEGLVDDLDSDDGAGYYGEDAGGDGLDDFIEDDIGDGAVEVELAEEQGEDVPRNGDRIVSHWNLAEYLPPAVRVFFLVVVGEFLKRPKEKALQLREQLEGGTSGGSPSSVAPGPEGGAGEKAREGREGGTVGSLDELDDAMRSYVKDLVGGYLTRRALRMASEIAKYNTGPDSFPMLAGSHRELRDPALEFVKAVTHVLSLDRECHDEVVVLRRVLLAQLGVREFAQGAAWEDPSMSHVLRDAICGFCNARDDLDICRDATLCTGDPEDRWRCKNCGHRYDLAAIELRLVEETQKRLTRYQLQDRRCKRCRKAASRVLSERCPCSGEYELDESAEDFAKAMRTLHQAAAFHGFTWLRETVEYALGETAASAEQPPETTPAEAGEDEEDAMAVEAAY